MKCPICGTPLTAAQFCPRCVPGSEEVGKQGPAAPDGGVRVHEEIPAILTRIANALELIAELQYAELEATGVVREAGDDDPDALLERKHAETVARVRGGR